jgi:sugar/nucleoside kinase (ribokinase family)
MRPGVERPEAGEMEFYPGGTAYYSSIGARRVAGPGAVSVVSLTGKDFPLSNLTRRGILTAGVTVLHGKSPVFRNFYNAKQSKRTVKVELNVADGFAPRQEHISHISDARFVHISTMRPVDQLAFIDFVREHQPNAIISVDTLPIFIEEHTDRVASAIRRSDIVFMNAEERKLLAEKLGEADSRRLLADKLVILKRGKSGAVATWTSSKSRPMSVKIRAPKVLLKDPTGAGDVLAGAFLAKLHEVSGGGLNFKQTGFIRSALRTAVMAASESIKAHGVEHLVPLKPKK